jgi:ubiquinone/menaquinone biosynthesis C-methylase UbiE
MKVIEVGCGSGAYTLFVSEAVGKKGKVFALDIQEKMLGMLKRKIKKNKVKNIEMLHASAYKIPLKSNSIDLAYMITVLQEIPDKEKALKEIKRILKPKGLISVTEFFPDPDYPLISTTKNDLTKTGFKIKKIFGNFWTYTVLGIK